jgi:hypothetical protein
MALNDRTVKLQEFTGENFIDWLQHVEMCRSAATWTDEATAQRAKLMLKGKAGVWLQNLISAGTEGLDAWFPPLPDPPAAQVRAPNLRTLMDKRFGTTTSPAEQDHLRSTLTMKDNEDVYTFYDRVVSVQFELDKSFPTTFRVDSKAAYMIVHDQLVLSNFLFGLRPDIRMHVMTNNSATIQGALEAAVTFERGNKAKRGKISAFTDGANKSVDDLANQLVSIAMSKMKNQESHRGGRGGSIQAQGTPNTSDFCKYCGYVGHEKLKCNIRKKDEAKGIFLPQSPYFSPGRVGRGKGGRGGHGGQSSRGRVHEMGASGGQLTSNPEVTQWQQNGPPNMPTAHFQEPPQMSGQLQPPTFYNAQGGAAALCDQGAFRFFPTQGNQ